MPCHHGASRSREGWRLMPCRQLWKPQDRKLPTNDIRPKPLALHRRRRAVLGRNAWNSGRLLRLGPAEWRVSPSFLQSRRAGAAHSETAHWCHARKRLANDDFSCLA